MDTEVGGMMNQFKVIAADIDGTLCMKGEDLMPLTRSAIKKLHAEGVKFGLATGRPVDSRVLSYAEKWDLGFPFDFAIGMNGGELYDLKTNATEKYYLLSKENIRKILAFLMPYDINAIVYVDGYEEVRCLKMDDFMISSKARNKSHVIVGGIDTLAEYDTGKVEVQFKGEMRDEMLKVVEANQNPDWIMTQTYFDEHHCTFEFQDPRVNKGVGLEKYCERYGIPMEDVLAFGDQENDIGLMKSAGYGVCLSNGADLTKSLAKAITEHDVLDDGVGHWLYDHVIDSK